MRWVRVDPETLTLDSEDLERNINEKTQLVAVGLASNAVGTVNDVAAVAERAHAAGAGVAVDAVHAAPHFPMDRHAIGADVITCSAYKFFGPHVGVTAIKRDLFERLNVYRLDPAPEHAPNKLETGSQNHEGIAGVMAPSTLSPPGRMPSFSGELASAMRFRRYTHTAIFRAGLRHLPRRQLYHPL